MPPAQQPARAGFNSAYSISLAAGGASLARQPLGLQPLVIGVEVTLCGLMLAHGLLGVGAASCVARLALFGGENAGGTCSEIFRHGAITPQEPNGSCYRTAQFRLPEPAVFLTDFALPPGGAVFVPNRPALSSFSACSTQPWMCETMMACARLKSRTSAASKSA
jgi:hypothetical protein